MKALNAYISESILASSGAGKAKVEAEYKKYGLDPDKISLNPDGTIDYKGSIKWAAHYAIFDRIPFRFREVRGEFIVSYNKLTTLDGCPVKVHGKFDCSNNQLTNLEGGPEMTGKYMCNRNMLTTLEGAPKVVDGDFFCIGNKLTTLKGGPMKVEGNFSCDGNKLISLDGMPKEVGGNFSCCVNKIKTKPLGKVPSTIKGIFIAKYQDGDCPLTKKTVEQAGIKANNYFF